MEVPGELFGWRVLVSAGWPVLAERREGDAARTALARIDFQLGTNGGDDTGFHDRWQALSCLSRRAEHYVDFAALWEAPGWPAIGRDGALDRIAFGRLYTLGATCVTSW